MHTEVQSFQFHLIIVFFFYLNIYLFNHIIFFIERWSNKYSKVSLSWTNYLELCVFERYPCIFMKFFPGNKPRFARFKVTIEFWFAQVPKVLSTNDLTLWFYLLLQNHQHMQPFCRHYQVSKKRPQSSSELGTKNLIKMHKLWILFICLFIHLIIYSFILYLMLTMHN